MPNVWLTSNQGFYYDIFYAVPYLLTSFAIRLSMTIDVSENRLKTTFMTNIIFSRVFIEYELLTVFVDSVVSQMHA